MKRVLVIILCLVMVGTSVSIPKYAYADSTDGDIRINASTGFCNLGDTIEIEVNDQDLNANSASPDSYAVTVSSTTQVGEQEQLLEEISVDLLETDANSGRFVGNVTVSAATGAAIGVKEILAQTSGKITAKYNDSGMWKFASITIEAAMLSGAVSEPDGSLATGGNIEVVKTVEGQAPEFIGAYPINPNGGTYQLPRLVAGSYSIRAYQPDATDHMGSQWLEINVDAGGNCSDKDGVPFSAPNFIFQEVLFSGTVIDKETNTLLDDEFHLELRSLNDKIGHDLRFDWESKNGVYRIAALNDGEYALRAVSQKEGNTDSCELYFKIENGIITDPGSGSPLASFDLQLTEQQVSGTVYYSGETPQPVANSGVVVFDSAMRYVYSKNTDASGNFSIGGLMPGYKLQASVYGHEDYFPKNTITVEVDEFNHITPANMDLLLQKKEPTLKWVESFVLHYNEIGIHLGNVSLLNIADNNWSVLTATISGNELAEPITLTCTRRGDSWGEESVFYFPVDESDREDLNFGKYTVEIKNGNNILPFENNELDIIQQLQLRPGTVERSQYQSGNTSLRLDSDVVNNIRLPRPWDAGEVLKVKVFKSGTEYIDANADYIDDVTVQPDLSLQLNIPACPTAESGRRDIEVYRGTQLIARGGFDVGVSTIGFVTANEGSDEAAIWGDYLGSYLADQTRAELWLDGEKLADSKYTNVGGDVRFKFEYTFKAGVNYTLKVFINNVEKELPGTGAFEAVPRLDWSNVDFTSNVNKSFTLNESSLTNFGWSSGDNIRVNIYGPGAWDYSVTNGANLDVTDDNLILRVTEEEANGRNKHLDEGEYFIAVNKTVNDRDIPVGFAEVIIAYDTKNVLRGTVLTSNGDNADGGYIDLGKEGDGWGTRLSVGHNGSFYALKDRLRGSGKYYATAVPSETSVDASGRLFFNVENDDFSTVVTVNLNTVQITGTVEATTDSGSTAVQSGYVDVIDPSQDWRRVQSAPINPDGSYKLGGLDSGKMYYLNANGPWEMDYVSSDFMEVIYNDSPLTGKNLVLNRPQITGTAKDGNDIDLKGDQYEVNIRSMGDYDSNCEIKTRDGRFLIGNLKPGIYAFAIAPRGESTYARSAETIVTIGADGTVSQDSLALKLTQPMLTGSVYDKRGALVKTDGYVEVWEDRLDGSGYICSIPLINGTYKAGGLSKGDYKIRAGASDYTDLFNTNSSSHFINVTLGDVVATQDLYLTDRSIPRMMWVNDVNAGYDRINARILNYKSIDMMSVEAEIVNLDESPLDPAFTISSDKIKLSWYDDRSEEADFEFIVDERLRAIPGKYLLKLTYTGSDESTRTVINDQDGSDAFDIAYSLGVLPRGIKPEDTPGMSLKLFVDDFQGNYLPNLWDNEDTLTAKLIANDGKIYSDLSCTINTDNTLTMTMPTDSGKLPEGWTNIELYKAGELLAFGGLQVGVPVIERVEDTGEGNDRISLHGRYLEQYDNPQTIARILDNSDHELWESNSFELIDDRLEFRFEGLNLPAGEYKFSLISGNQVITTRYFYIAPWVICTPHAIASGQNPQVIVKKSSTMDIFQWSQSSDSIDDFKVRIGGPAHWYDIDSSNGLSFDGDNLKVDINGQDGELLLSQTGFCWLEVYKNDRKIGYSNLTIGQDAVSAIVKDPDGYVVPNARVRITNLNEYDNNSNEFTTDNEGRFYIPKQDLPRKNDSNFNGDYSFLVMAPADSQYATSLTIRNINADNNNEIILVLAQPQITGVVKAGGINPNGGVIEVQKQDGDQWKYLFDFNLNQDGVFKIGGLEDGTYFIRAREDDKNKDYVSSDFVEVQVTGTTVKEITLNLNPIQIRGTALNPMGELLQGDEYFVNIRPLDQENRDNYGEWRSEGAAFRIGALKPCRYAISLRPNRNTTYTQSLETVITVKEDRTVDGGDLSIKLTQAKLSGNVKAGTLPFKEGYVEVYNGTWQRTNYVTTVELDEYGNFRIGGIPDGTYFIRAALWNESGLKTSYSQSVMTEINIGEDTNVQLSLVDNVKPRIRSVYDAGIGDDRINVHIVNLNGIEDFSKLKAQIFDENGVAVGDPITGEKYFSKDNWYDSDKDEGDLNIWIDGYLQLKEGKYRLELSYYNEVTEKYEIFQNETPFIADFNGFNIVHNLDIRPYAAVPEETGGKVLELGINTDNKEYQWPTSDKVAVRMYYDDGSFIPLEETIAEDNTLTVTLPAEGLAYGNYPIMVYVDGQLFARSEFVVGYPRIDGVNDITEEQPDIRIYGENLIIYMDETTKAEIYDSTGAELLLTSNELWFDGDIVIGLNGKNLPVGEYILKLYYKNGQEVILTNEGRFKSVDILTATPSYYVSNATMGKTVTLKSADGSNAPWNNGDSLRIHIRPDRYDEEYVITPASGDVTEESVTFTIPENLSWDGHCSITINKIDENGDEIYVGYAHFYLINKEQLTGTILDTTGKPVPYSFVYMERKGDGWNTGFDADGNGNFGIYDLEPGQYTVFAATPKGLSYMDSDGFDIIIDDEGNCNIATHNFTLKPGRKITGTISLPDGINAPTDGLVGWVTAWNDNDTLDNGDDDKYFGREFRFEEGAHTTDYSIIVSDDFDAYYVKTWCEGLGLMNTDNLYSIDGSVNTRAEADMVDVTSSDRDNINLELRQGKSISGTVSLPSGVAPVGGIYVDINVNDDKGNDDYKDDFNGGIQVKIPEGQSSAAYTIVVAPSDKYVVEYKVEPKYLYLDNGFYQTNTTTVYDRELAAEVNGTTDLTGIDLTLIRAKLIQGTISLPVGYSVPEGGVTGFIAALIGIENEDESDDQWSGIGFEIKNGTSTQYTIKVPATWNNISIDLWSDSEELVDCTTFYNENGSVFNQKDATLISLDYDVNEGINIKLQKGNAITGTITLPSPAPQGGRAIMVQAIRNNDILIKNDDIIAEEKVTIAEGQSSAAYTIYVPALDGYKVNYTSDPAYLYEDKGYYSTQGTVFDFNLGAVVNASNPVPGINLAVSLLKKPICDKAEVTTDGTSVQLNFSKPLDAATISTAPAGFALQVGATAYEVDTVTLNEKGNMLTLHIKDYKIFKDYKDIKVTYAATAGIQSMDGMRLDGFEKEVINKSTKEFSILTNFVGTLLNKNAVINVVAAGEDIQITDNGVVYTGTGTIAKEISIEGSHEVVVSIAGRKQKTTYSFTIDKTAPDVMISSPANATILKNNHDGIAPVITFGADTVASTRMISLNGGASSTVISNGGLTYTGDSIREAGHYVLTASAKDAAGNIKTVSSTFDILWDNGSPVITINGVANGGTYETATVTVSLTTDSGTPADNTNLANYTYKASLKLPTGNIVTKENGVPVLTGPGTYRLEVVATNPGYTDKTSSKVVEFTIDNLAPVAAIDGVENNAVYNSAVTPIIRLTDEVASQQILINNAVMTLTRGGVSVAYHIGDTISLDGVYILTAKTKDSINHTSNIVTKNFTIDKSKPVISIAGALNGATYKDQNVTLTIKTNEGDLTVVDGADVAVTLNGSGQHTFSGTENKVVNYKVIAKAVDAAGNMTEQQISFSIDRLPVNIIVNGITEGMLVSTNPEISFTTFEGTQEKQGTTVTIDNVAFIGGRYSVAGSHTLVAKYTSGEVTYTKTLHFTIDKTAPTVSVASVLKNAEVNSNDIIAKAGDIITVRATAADSNGVGDVILSIGTTNILMNYISAENYYEGKFNVESGSFDPLAITIGAKDKAGNYSSMIYSKTLTIDNTKPLVSLITNPTVVDGTNGVFKSPDMKVTLVAGTNDTIYWNLNGSSSEVTGSKVLTPSQGTNVLVYHAKDLAGNVSDAKVYVFEYDSIQPAAVTLTSQLTGTTSMEYLKINGTVAGEGSKTGTKVLLKKSGEIIAKASVKTGDSFEIDNIKLAEGLNTYTLTAVDYAGNESRTVVTLTRTLDSTAPVLNVEKTDDTNYVLTSNENLVSSIVKFNGVVVTEDNITAVPVAQSKVFHITTPQPVEGTNVLNVTAFDTAGNMGTGSYTSTYIPRNTAQNDLPLNDNASMDIPNDAFDTSTQILVKTVDVNGITNYKPLGAAISFEFKNDLGASVEPVTPLLIKNYIGVGLNGVVLMHVNASGVIDNTLTAKVIKSTDAGYQTTIDTMGVDDPYYVIDTGYLIFKTTNFSSYQVAQDNVAPVLAVTTSDFVINKADKTAGEMKIEGTITDTDPEVRITEVIIDGVTMDINSITADKLDESYSITLDLSDGMHEVAIKASDAAGNTSTVIRNYQVDITQPILTASVAVSNTNRNSVDISINTGENAEITVNGVSKGQFDGGGIIAFNLTDNAVNTIIVAATDSYGNTTTAPSISVTRDSMAPVITITGVNNGDVYGNDVTIAVNATDPHTPDTDITMDGSNYNPGAFSSEGQHTLIVSSTDTFGNTSSKTVVFTIDKSVPVINVTGADNDGKYNANKTLNITADNIDELIITKSTDNQAPVNVDATVTGTAGSATVALGTADQQHNYKIVITARKTVSGQVRSASTTISFTIDRKNPVIASTTASQTESTTINLTGTIDEAADIYLNNVLKITDNTSGNFSITGQSLNLGLNTFQIKAVDAVGNETLYTISVRRTEPVNNGGGNGGYTGGVPGGAPGGVVPSEGNKDDKPVTPDTDNSDNAPEGQMQIISEKPVKKGSIATATTTNTELSTAIADTEKDTNGVKTVTIELQEVKGAKTYTEVLPVKAMTDGGKDLNVQIVTPLGTVTVSGDMFTSIATNKKNNIGISITTADKSKLKEATLKAIGNKPVIQLSAAMDGKAVTWSNPNAPVTVAIPYKPTATELRNPDHIVVWYIDGAGKVQTVASGKYDAKTGTVTFTTTHFSTYAVAYVKKSFKDITKLEAKIAIEFVASKGIMNGNTDTMFEPNGTVTKGDFIAYLMNTLSLTAEFSTNFADVKASDRNYNAIGAAKKLGILSGTSKSKFYPNDLITKEEMAIYTVLAMKLSQKTLIAATGKDISKYSDAYKVSNSAVNSIAKLIKSGILKIDGKKIYSKDNLTRAEVAEILYRIYKAD